MGTPQIAADILEQLLCSDIQISGAVTRPDKPKGRGHENGASEVKAVAKKHKISVYQPKNKIELEKTVKKLDPDLVLVAAFGMMLPDSVFEAPKFKAINVHPSLLPLYRGPAPIEAPILAGDKKTGVTIMKISTGMDEGDILDQKEIELKGIETAPELEKSLAELTFEMLKTVIPDWIEGKIKPQKQDNSKATYTKMIKKEDGKIDFQKETAIEIERKSRAFQPWPGLYTHFKGKKLDLYDIEIYTLPVEPGKVATHGDQILIGTKEGLIIPKFLKLEGKSKISSADFLRGYPDIKGSILK